MSVRRRRRGRNPSDDHARWAELEQGARAGGAGGGAYYDAAAWRNEKFPIFKDELTNTLLQRIDSTGGVGVRFTAHSIIPELPGKLQRGARMRIGKAIEALEAKKFIQPYSMVVTKKKLTRPWAFTWELTEHGADAALASRIVPGLVEAEKAPDVDEIPASYYGRPITGEEPVFSHTSLAEPHAGERALLDRYLSRSAADAAMPWRTFLEGAAAFDPVALASGQRFHFAQEYAGPYVVFRAFDDSNYMIGSSMIVGELGLLLAPGDERVFGDRRGPYASVAWQWVHPEWDSQANPIVARNLLRLAAHEAAKHGLALASGVSLSPSADRIWSRQARAGLAKPELHNKSARRYFLQHPPPAELANPGGQDDALRAIAREILTRDKNDLDLWEKLLREAERRGLRVQALVAEKTPGRRGRPSKAIESTVIISETPWHFQRVGVEGRLVALKGLVYDGVTSLGAPASGVMSFAAQDVIKIDFLPTAMENPGQDQDLRTLEREAKSDPAARVRWYAALLRAGRVYPEHLTALAILGDQDARTVSPPRDVWRYAEGSQTVNLKYVNGLSSLGAFFTILSAVAVFESMLGKWNDEARSRRESAAARAMLAPRIRRVLLVTRAWLAGGPDPPVVTRARGSNVSVRPPGPVGRSAAGIRGRALEVRQRFDAWHGAPDRDGDGLVDSQELDWFFRQNFGRVPDSYTANALYMLERALYEADLATSPDYGYLELSAESAATTVIGHCESLYTNHLATTLIDPVGAVQDPARFLGPANERLERLLRYVLTPWVLAGSPGRWDLAKVPPLQ